MPIASRSRIWNRRASPGVHGLLAVDGALCTIFRYRAHALEQQVLLADATQATVSCGETSVEAATPVLGER